MKKELRDSLNYILVNKSARELYPCILKLIPELEAEIGFNHKHPHHHLDVWNHTLLALDNLRTNDLEANMALLLHDIGKPFCYQDDEDIRHFYGHAVVSSDTARDILTRLGYDDLFIDNVCYLVLNHDTLIDIDDIDNLDLVFKLLDIQYADARAHHPSKVSYRINILNDIKKELYKKKVRTRK